MALKLRVPVRFPAAVQGSGGLKVTKSGGVWTVQPAFDQLASIAGTNVTDPTSKEIWIYDPVTGVYNVLTLAGLGDALYTATSTTSLAIGTGAKTFTTQSGKDYSVGSWLLAASDANSANYMVGQVTAYSGTSLTINVSAVGGSGTHADWTIRLSGPQGATGSTGATGPAGADGSVVGALAPQGRLTLTSLVAVTTSDVTGATSIYYTPAYGNQIPIYDGSSMILHQFSQLTLALDSTNTDAGYHQSGKNFDLFVIDDSGTLRLGTGPAWSSDTSRGTGAGTTELAILSGMWTNANAITIRYGASTVSVAANEATYVGTFRAVADGQTEDSLVKRYLYNAYNQSQRQLLRNDATASWTYSTATYRQANSSTSNQVSYVAGLAGSPLDVQVMGIVVNSTSTWNVVFSGIGIDSTTVNGATVQEFSRCDASTVPGVPKSYYTGYAQLGKHDLMWLEKGSGSGDTQTWVGTEATGKYKSGIWGRVWA